MDKTKHIGMDVHKEAISIAVLNSSGKLVMESTIETKASTILQFFQGLSGSLQVTFEEGTWAAWLYDLLKPHVTELVVCNPRKNALLKQGSKSDRIDARKLATNFPALWRDPSTPDRERKRMLRLLLEDVTALRGEQITLHVRFKGGAAKTLTLLLPLNSWQQRQTGPDVVKEIDQLLDHHTYPQIAAILNERGMRSGEGKAFTSKFIARIQRSYALIPRYDRLRKAGKVILKEMAALLGMPKTIQV